MYQPSFQRLIVYKVPLQHFCVSMAIISLFLIRKSILPLHYIIEGRMRGKATQGKKRMHLLSYLMKVCGTQKNS